MSLINKIRCSINYNFRELLNTVDFDELGEYVNIHDKNDMNLLLWMCKLNYDYIKIIKYIDKYYKLFDYDKIYSDAYNSLLFGIHRYCYDFNIIITILKKINFIKEITKTNKSNLNICEYLNLYVNYGDLINFAGILSCLHVQNQIISCQFYGPVAYNNSINILVNCFGILNKLSIFKKYYYVYRFLDMIKINAFKKIILVYGRY
jgi:hypothetical protein